MRKSEGSGEGNRDKSEEGLVGKQWVNDDEGK